MARLRSSLAAGAVATAVATSLVPSAALAAPVGTESNRPATLAAAKNRLSQARAQLADAQTSAQTVRIEAANGEISPDLLAQLRSGGMSPFNSGTPELVRMAALRDDTDVQGVMSKTPIEELASMTPVVPVVQPVAPAKDPVKLADDQVAVAKKHEDAAQALVEQLDGLTNPDGPGAAKLGSMCAQAGVVVDECAPPHWTERHLLFDSVLIGRYVNSHWDAVKTVGGWRPADAYPDHPSGRAVDIMMPNGGSTKGDVQLGNAIAQYFQKHAKEYGIEYMIWRQRQWTADSRIGDWNGMSDRGSPTANHMDHVHITVKDGHSSTAFKELLAQARASAG